nr:unnamed protein product [Callosobruchus analis]
MAGIEYNMLVAFSRKLNFTFQMIEVNTSGVDSPYTRQLVSRVQHGELDFAFGGFTLNYDFMEFVDFGAYIMHDLYIAVFGKDHTRLSDNLDNVYIKLTCSWMLLMTLLSVLVIGLLSKVAANKLSLQKISFLSLIYVLLRSAAEQPSPAQILHKFSWINRLLVLSFSLIISVPILTFFKVTLSANLIHPFFVDWKNVDHLAEANFKFHIQAADYVCLNNTACTVENPFCRLLHSKNLTIFRPGQSCDITRNMAAEKCSMIMERSQFWYMVVRLIISYYSTFIRPVYQFFCAYRIAKNTQNSM